MNSFFSSIFTIFSLISFFKVAEYLLSSGVVEITFETSVSDIMVLYLSGVPLTIWMIKLPSKSMYEPAYSGIYCLSSVFRFSWIFLQISVLKLFFISDNSFYDTADEVLNDIEQAKIDKIRVNESILIDLFIINSSYYALSDNHSNLFF